MEKINKTGSIGDVLPANGDVALEIRFENVFWICELKIKPKRINYS